MAPPCLRPLLRFKSCAVLFGTPLLLLALPLLIPTQEAKCAYVIILMAVYWCTEVIPLAVTSLLPAILFPMFGILESKKVCMQYLKDTNMLFVGGLIVAVAVEHWNLHRRIALRVLLIVGVKPPLLMLGFMGVTAFLSMWISNTATTAMMVPIVQAVLDQMNSTEQDLTIMDQPMGLVNSVIELEEKNAMSLTDVQVLGNGHIRDEPKAPGDRELNKRISKGMTLCVCYAASIGGTATLTGTGPNLVLKGQMNQLFPENGDILNFASWFGFAFPNMILMLTLSWFWLQFSFMGFNFRKTWGCGMERSDKEKSALRVLKEEHQKLGSISFAEFSVLMLFLLLILLWFSRDPGFVPGWATFLFNKDEEYVTDATVALFVALLLFIVPATKPKFNCYRQNSFNPEQNEEGFWSVEMAGESDDPIACCSTLGHCSDPFTCYRSLHRMHQQCSYGHPLSTCLCVLVAVHRSQSFVHHDPLYTQCLFCLHAPGGDTSKRDSVFLWSPPCFRHGKIMITIP
nr:solute carrier family 13 member 5 isoform X2 [Pelodiscus sinensis]|eukprot:XP_025035617.1 solute carrier family 13 member 5 isoform X2 [Pelodiscus sinensis]